jgi:hypothetical protein
MDEVNFDRKMRLVSRVADGLEEKIEPEEMAVPRMGGGRITIGEWTYIPFRQEMMGVGVGSSTAKIAPTSPDELTRLVYANRPPLVLRPARREPYQDPKAIQSAKFEMAMRKLKRDFNR